MDRSQALRGINPLALERSSLVTKKPLVSGEPEVLHIPAGPGSLHSGPCGFALRIDGAHLALLLELTESVVLRRPLTSPFLKQQQRLGALRALATEARVT